jgi:hypothetical protein|tara:strand:+ start:911 stop:1219 length:309 start_codon:yes stop_codon:yes gene_type:complete
MLLKRITGKENTIESYYNSSNVLKSIYHESTADLDVVFKSGAVYRYRNVPNTVLLKLENSKSQGKFLNQEIRDKFQSTKVVNVNVAQLVEHIQMLQEEENKK